MRRFLILVLPALLTAAGTLSTTPAGAQVDHEDRRRGLIYDGLQRVGERDFCRGNYRLATVTHRGIPVCTHGPDPAPEGVDVLADRPAPEPEEDESTAENTFPTFGGGTAAATAVPCAGNGTDGFRVRLLYVRASDRADGYASWLGSFRQWAARVDDVFNTSAAETGGSRHVRFVHDASCVPVVDNVVLSPRGDDSFDSMLSELRSRGYSRTDRKYLVWADANVYCGIAQVYYDDSPGQFNASNGHPYVAGEVARVDKGCWGLTNMVEAHELTHVLGGVQTSAPNATSGNHCRDDYDRLCYSDGSGVASIVCGDPVQESRLDCNHDDYFSTAPPPGSYLESHWNVANSRFLFGSAGGTTSTTSPTTSPPATSPPTTSPPTTSPPPGFTTTTRPPSTSSTTTTTRPPTPSAPSAPQSLYAVQPSGTATGVALSWGVPTSAGNPAFTTYRIYRGVSAISLSPVAEVGAGTRSYVDSTTTPRVIYWYAVSAVSSTAESPRSNLARMLAK